MNIPINTEADSLLSAMNLGGSADNISSRLTELVANTIEKSSIQVMPGVSIAKGNLAEIADSIQKEFTDSEILFFATQHFLQILQEIPNSKLIKG